MIVGQQPNNPTALPLGEDWRRIWDAGCGIETMYSGPGNINWTRLDAHVATCKAKGTKVLYTFGRTPAWASVAVAGAPTGIYGGKDNLPMDPVYWNTFVFALSTRYKGQISAYEMGNEVNYAGFSVCTPAQLYDQQQRSWKIIKANDPAALVFTPSVTWSWAGNNALTAVEGFFKLGLPNYSDGISYHGYIPSGQPDSRLLIRGLNALKVQYGSTLPLINTEWGGSDLQAVPLVQQRAWLLNELAVQEQEGVAVSIIYQYENQSHAPHVTPVKALTVVGQAWAEAYNSASLLPAVTDFAQVS